PTDTTGMGGGHARVCTRGDQRYQRESAAAPAVTTDTAYFPAAPRIRAHAEETARPPEARRRAPRRVPAQARLYPHCRTGRGTAQAVGEARVRHPEARREPAPLRPAARDRRRHEELGRAQGPEPRSGGAPARDRGRGPPDRVQQVRGYHTGGRV